MIPVVEFALETPLDRGGGGTTGTINPGVLWAEHVRAAVGLEAVIPVNDRSGKGVGWLAQLHFFLDDLFPNSFGRPLVRADVTTAMVRGTIVTRPRRPPAARARFGGVRARGRLAAHAFLEHATPPVGAPCDARRRRSRCASRSGSSPRSRRCRCSTRSGKRVDRTTCRSASDRDDARGFGRLAAARALRR